MVDKKADLINIPQERILNIFYHHSSTLYTCQQVMKCDTEKQPYGLKIPLF